MADGRDPNLVAGVDAVVVGRTRGTCSTVLTTTTHDRRRAAEPEEMT
ncbi:MAG: hypothetical protein AVDCRST_MAG32-1062 [uncultured Nocardioides sp.]|uniref:Uncharacterized protein n=1 Tax=uncultured Nocardioides sp. TaxID=198441 RepID=A0A6J4N137_9ACTN|nr:MAG: hypothetical protein AVDCRST_MAG32-1062 [uncultured Nocardioides sp.]